MTLVHLNAILKVETKLSTALRQALILIIMDTKLAWYFEHSSWIKLYS